MPDLKHIIGYGTAIILLGFAVRFAVNEHIDRLNAQHDVQMEQKIIDARAQAQKEADAKFEEQIKALKTVEQAQPIIQKIFVPIQGQNNALGTPITVKKGDLTPGDQERLPDAPGLKSDAPLMILTPDQQVFAAQQAVQCQKDKSDLGACVADKGSLTKQINTLKTASKGGTWVQRVGREMKCLAISGGGAGLGAILDKKHPALGAMGGAVVGEAGCKIFF